MDLALEPDKRIQPAGGGGSMEPPGLGKRLMSVLRAVYHILRRGLCRKRLMMDLHLLLGRGKLAGRALRNLVAAAHHPHVAHHLVAVRSRAGAGGAASSSSASAIAADLPFAPNPRDVEFSCTTTPSSSSYEFAAPGRALFPFRIRGRGGGAAARGCDGLDSASGAAPPGSGSCASPTRRSRSSTRAPSTTVPTPTSTPSSTSSTRTSACRPPTPRRTTMRAAVRDPPPAVMHKHVEERIELYDRTRGRHRNNGVIKQFHCCHVGFEFYYLHV